MKLNNRTIWVTGASSGIGEALALGLASKNCTLILTARNLEALERVKQACLEAGAKRVEVLALDMSQPTAIEAAVLQINSLGLSCDVLINNSGVSQRSFGIETPITVDRSIMEVNYFGAVYLSKLLAPGMVNQRSGMLVAISSLSGKFGWKQRSAYAASKFALVGFFESLRAELADKHVQVLLVFPGRIKTNISMKAITASGEAHNQMDAAQSNGISAETCARRIIHAMENDKKEILIAGKEGLMLYIRRLAPWLYFRIAANRNPNI